MARIVSEIQFVGPLGDFSAYRMHGQDKIILRRKGGASKAKIKRSKAFEKTRKLNAEFGGRATASKWFMRACWPMKALADYNVAGPINALFKPIQELDTYARFGKRHIELSKNPKLFEGFLFNKLTPFDTTLRASIDYTLSKDERTAQVVIPALMPGINFYPSQRHSVFSVIITLGIVPDLYFSDLGRYMPEKMMGLFQCYQTSSEWMATNKSTQPITLDLMIDKSKYENLRQHSMVLAIGIRYGASNGAQIMQVKRAGCAKVLGMV